MGLNISDLNIKGIPLESAYANIMDYRIINKNDASLILNIYSDKAARDANPGNFLEQIIIDGITIDPTLATLPQLYSAVLALVDVAKNYKTEAAARAENYRNSLDLLAVDPELTIAPEKKGLVIFGDSEIQND